MLGAEVLQDIGAHHIRFWVTKGFLTEARGRHSVDWQCSSFCQLRIHLARTCSRGARCMCAFPRALLRHLPAPPPIPGPQTQRTHFLWDLMFFSEDLLHGMVPLKEQQFVPGSTFPVAQTAGHRRIPHFSCRGECFGSVKVPGTQIQRDLLSCRKS